MIVLVDADNTLWDTCAIYTGIFDQFVDTICSCGSLERDADDLQIVRQLDAQISSLVGTFNYNPELLCTAFIGHKEKCEWPGEPDVSSLLALGGEGVSQDLRKRIVELFSTLDRRPPELLPGAEAFLHGLRAESGISLVLLSEAPYLRIVETLHYHNLCPYFDHILSARKDEPSLRRVKAHIEAALASCGDHDVVAVGDSLERDIAPALAAGFQTLYIPGPLYGDERQGSTRNVEPDFVATSLGEACSVILGMYRDGCQAHRYDDRDDGRHPGDESDTSSIIVSWRDIDVAIGYLSDAIAASDFQPDVIVAIQRGGLIPAVCLSHKLSVRNCIVIPARKTLSDAAWSDTCEVVLGPMAPLARHKRVLIVDDIVGEGDTIQLVRSLFAERCQAIRAVSLFVNSKRCRCPQLLDSVWRSVDRWVVFPWENRK